MDACKSQFHGYFSCLSLYCWLSAGLCLPLLATAAQPRHKSRRAHSRSSTVSTDHPGVEPVHSDFFFCWRQVHAPCGIWTRAFFVLPLPGDGTAGWAMRERMACSIFFTCRHIRAFTSVIMCTVQQKFSEKMKCSCLDSNPNHQIHGPTPWPLHHDILRLWTASKAGYLGIFLY